MGKGDGHGRFVNPDGSVVEGRFVKSQLLGDGRSVDASGEMYEGQFKGHRRYLTAAYGPQYGQAKVLRGKRHGFGTPPLSEAGAAPGPHPEPQPRPQPQP